MEFGNCSCEVLEGRWEDVVKYVMSLEEFGFEFMKFRVNVRYVMIEILFLERE